MLSRHGERCRFPHGHTRTIEVVVRGKELDENGMLVDFKALRLALEAAVERFDHAMAVNSADPLLPEMKRLYPADALVVFEDKEPTTEVIAKHLFDFATGVLREGFSATAESGATFSIKPSAVELERVRVWETPSSWAEYGI
jgi:6-pyruvoyltetrahydropterin/6-carboxytetrahydropterin synthase